MSALLDIKNAYLKLKSYVYYDKNLLFLRAKLAAFESDNNIEEVFKKLNDAIINQDDEYFDCFLSRINYKLVHKSFSKKEKDKNKLNTNNFITNNFNKKPYNIERFFCFIDCDIELHIISVLWLMYIASKLDATLKTPDNLYSNKFYKKDGKIENKGIRLFEPYYHQYQKWRDTAIEKVIECHQKKKDVYLINLDIRDYYPSVEMDFNFVIQSIPQLNRNEQYINKLLADIHARYDLTNYKNIIFKDFLSESINKFSLPIGLISSTFLANLYLNDFDQYISNDVNPQYYGRYVDDLLFVIAKDKDIEDKAYDQIISSLLPEKHGYPNLKVQDDKINVIYFKAEMSIAGIRQFKQELRKNSSEYRYLPDEEKNEVDFEEEVTSILFSDSTKKIRGIKEIINDKYKLSIYLTRHILSGKLWEDDEGKLNAIANQMREFFQGQILLDYIYLWEKLFTFYVIKGLKNEISFFKEEIEKVIDDISYSDKNILQSVQNCLKEHLSYSIGMAKALDVIEKNNQISEKFRLSCMVRDYCLSFPLLDIGYRNAYNVSLIHNNFSYYSEKKLQNIPTDYIYIPRYIYYHEYFLFIFVFTQRTNIDDIYAEYKKMIKHIKGIDGVNLFEKTTTKTTAKTDEQIIKYNLNNNKKDTLRLAVANIAIREEEIINNLKNNSRRRLLKKYTQISSVINQSIKGKADLLILPEVSVPLCFINTLMYQVKKNNIALIFGIEHIVVNDTVYNYICVLLPVKINNYTYVVPFFRQKNYYAPEEIELIEGLRKKVPQQGKGHYDYISWNNVNFTTFNCYELCDIKHRSNFKGMVDIVFAVEWNRDTNFYSRIADTVSRDLHCYFVQSNTSQYGDSCIVAPKKTEEKDILKVKGGINDIVLIEDVNIKKLREFQALSLFKQKKDPSFKVTPPGFNDNRFIPNEEAITNNFEST